MHVSRWGESSCAATPTVKLLRRDGCHMPCARRPWLTRARKRTRSGRAASQRARQGWHGRRRLARRSHAGSVPKGEPAPVTTPNREGEYKHGPISQSNGAPFARGRIAQAARTARGRAEPPWLVQERREGVCVLCVCRPQGQSPDLTCTRDAAHAERSACASRGPTAAARCRPVSRARPQGGGGRA